MPFAVLLVCTGNTCRSPMGEGILRSLVPSGSAVSVLSAGTGGPAGMPATDLAREVCASRGIDISGHLSRSVDQELIDDADLILAMTRWHADHIASTYPGAARRTFTLSEFAVGHDEDVPDPIGGPVEDYERAYSMIEGYLKDALPSILRLAGEDAR